MLRVQMLRRDDTLFLESLMLAPDFEPTELVGESQPKMWANLQVGPVGLWRRCPSAACLAVTAWLHTGTSSCCCLFLHSNARHKTACAAAPRTTQLYHRRLGEHDLPRIEALLQFILQRVMLTVTLSSSVGTALKSVLGHG